MAIRNTAAHSGADAALHDHSKLTLNVTGTSSAFIVARASCVKVIVLLVLNFPDAIAFVRVIVIDMGTEDRN